MAATVDARGLSCPQPVLLSRKAMQQEDPGMIEVLVDTGTSRDNVRRMAQKHGWQVKIQTTEDGFKLVLNKD